MDMTLNWSLYQRRESAAQFGTVAIGLLILVGSQTLAMRQELPVSEEPISLTIMAPAVAPDRVVEQVIQTPPEKQVVETPKEVVPVTEAPAPAIQEAVQPPKPAEPQVQPKGNPDAENLFAHDLIARIERKKIYPEAARDLGLTGQVEIEYELDRSGKLLRAEIVSSSGFKILDQAALRTVKSISFGSIPGDAWMGESSKVFRTKLGYSVNN